VLLFLGGPVKTPWQLLRGWSRGAQRRRCVCAAAISAWPFGTQLRALSATGIGSALCIGTTMGRQPTKSCFLVYTPLIRGKQGRSGSVTRRATSAAYEQGIIHRDLKPANVRTKHGPCILPARIPVEV